jgi:hypothetical protein
MRFTGQAIVVLWVEKPCALLVHTIVSEQNTASILGLNMETAGSSKTFAFLSTSHFSPSYNGNENVAQAQVYDVGATAAPFKRCTDTHIRKTHSFC